jgi:hypothetical protein
MTAEALSRSRAEARCFVSFSLTHLLKQGARKSMLKHADHIQSAQDRLDQLGEPQPGYNHETGVLIDNDHPKVS